MQKDFDSWNKRTTAALAGGGCRGDVCNNGRRTTVYLHARNRFSFYFCANMRPIACERSFPRLGQLAQNAVYRLMSRDVNRQLVGVGCFSLFAAACLRWTRRSAIYFGVWRRVCLRYVQEKERDSNEYCCRYVSATREFK